MITVASILWLLSGVASFFVALRRLWATLEEIFILDYEIIKYAALLGMFIFHLVGGLISLGISIYNHFKGD